MSTCSRTLSFISTYFELTEVVLAVLIPKFRFSLGKEDIVWEMNGIVQPTLKGKPGIPQLPMLIEAL
jgi:hypothetical protein